MLEGEEASSVLGPKLGAVRSRATGEAECWSAGFVQYLRLAPVLSTRFMHGSVCRLLMVGRGANERGAGT